MSAVGSDDSRLNGKRGLNVQIESKYHLTINGQWLLNREPFYKIYPGKIIQVTAHAVHVGNALSNLLDRVCVGNSSVRYILDFVLQVTLHAVHVEDGVLFYLGFRWAIHSFDPRVKTNIWAKYSDIFVMVSHRGGSCYTYKHTHEYTYTRYRTRCY